MDTIANLKEQAVAQTPVLLFDVLLSNGQSERWSTHQITLQSQVYSARVLRHNLFEIQTASEQGIDLAPKLSLTLANADSHFSELEAAVGWKGAKLTATFLFYDLIAGAAATESMVLFQGILNPPEEITEETFRLSATNRMNMQRVLLPPVRIQRRCPWDFPATDADRREAIDGGAAGRFSRLYPCGYSAGLAGGAGNLAPGGAPFTSCSFTRTDCQARGMFDKDSAGNLTRRFGGIEFVPPAIQVRSHGEGGSHASPVEANEARYNDFVPLIYGTAWIDPLVVFSRNDGNLTRMEALLALGEIHQVLKVLVNNVEIPAGVAGRNMTGSGWYNTISAGTRTGGFNPDFLDSGGNPAGDPYGSMACLSVVVPNQINNGTSLPRVKALVEGIKIETFDGNGNSLGYSFNNNPAWVLLDVLRRSHWQLSELDLPSFAAAAAFCDETIAATDNNGNPISVRRFQCNLAVSSRRTAADVIRGVRSNARLRLRYTNEARLAVKVENTLALEQPAKPAGSNAPAMVNGGWPAYVYADGTGGSPPSGILRDSKNASTVKMWSRPTADTPNRFSVKFQDMFNEYQQDSLAIADVDDVRRTGQEITGRLVVDGIPSYDQAARILTFFVDKSIRGNRYIEFDTTVKAAGQRVGDLITVTYAKEGLIGQPFRILKIAPGMNYRTVHITAQIHDDAWYQDTNGQLTFLPEGRRQPGVGANLPNPVTGAAVDSNGQIQYQITEIEVTGTDGTILSELDVQFNPPVAGQSRLAGIPLVSLQATVLPSGGTLAGNQTLYYAVTATDPGGDESSLSFTVRASIPAGSSTNSVQLNGLSFTAGTSTFSVYRGELPTQLHRIASGLAPAAQFTDTGLALQVVSSPDPHYDHANFYWRLEETDEKFATIIGANQIGDTSLSMPPNGYAGHVVRLVEGQGAGQERIIQGNTATTVTVDRDWDVMPDASTHWLVSEAAWHFGGRARSSPARFQVPNLQGRVVQVSGRSANVNNVESPDALAVVTRWKIGGGGTGVADQGPPPAPSVGTSAHGDGVLRFLGISFPALVNTQGVTSGTFTLHFRDELQGISPIQLAAAVDAAATSLSLSQPGDAAAGDLIQVESELMLVTGIQSGGSAYVVQRGAQGSIAAAHAAGARVYRMLNRTLVTPFEQRFFASPAAGSWMHTEWIPNIRLASLEYFVTNQFGPSPTAVNTYTQLADGGLRTLSGGQFNFQIDGLLGVLTDAAPGISVQQSFSIRDIYAAVKIAPVGAALLAQVNQNGQMIAQCTIADGQTSSVAVNGAELPVLTMGSTLTLDILAVGTAYPGRDLTVTIRI
jgi:hypothetical protein